jgi:hypothetical protein
MKRFTIVYFLFVCISLLNGMPQLLAHSVNKSIAPVSQLLTIPENGCVDTGLKRLVISSKAIQMEREELETDLEEEDETEREQLCLKKNLVSSNLFTAVFYAQPAHHIYHAFSTPPSNYSNSSSIAIVKAYIRFLVFRI